MLLRRVGYLLPLKKITDEATPPGKANLLKKEYMF